MIDKSVLKTEPASDDGKTSLARRPYYELFANLLCNCVSIRLRNRKFRPLMTNFYITKRCNLRCRYCYPPGVERDVDTNLALKLLEKIRPHNPAINFTGGEPVLHPDLPVMLKAARKLRFFPVLLSTNGLDIDPILPHLHLIDHVIVSLDSLDATENEGLVGVPDATSKVVRNIERLASLAREKRFNFSLHAVICEENLDGLGELTSLCERLNATLNVSPEHVGDRPKPELRQSDRYRRAIRRLRALKRQGKPIGSSQRYLDIIESFKPHRCYPFLSPRVNPDGKVHFPCYVTRERSVNLLDYPSLYELMQQEAEWMYDRPECRQRCYLACYLEVASYVQNPLRLIKEIPFRRHTLGPRRVSSVSPNQPQTHE